MPSVSSLLLLSLIATALADPLGPLPEGTTLRDTTEHPEFVRYHLSATDGGERAFIIELTRAAEGATPVCTGGDTDLWVRQDLSDGAESFDWDPLPAIVDQACERLDAHAPELRGRMSTAPDPVARELGEGPALTEPMPRSTVWSVRALHAVVIGWFLLLAAAAVRPNEGIAGRLGKALGLTAAALVVRGLLSPRRLLLGGDAAYMHLLTAQGIEGSNPYYGDGWASFMGLFWRLLGGPADHALAVNLGVSALAVPLLYGCVKVLTKNPWAAGAAAAMLALMPLPVAISGSESHFILAGTLQLAALYGAARGDRVGGLLAAVSVGLLVHLRPMQGLFALLPLGVLVYRRRWESLALAVGLVGWRAVALLQHLQGELPPVVSKSNLHFTDLLPGAGSAVVPLDPGVTPLLVTALAAWALKRREAWWMGGAVLLGTLPYLPLTHDSVFDPMRFQLPAQAWLCGLAGVTLAAVRARETRVHIAVGALLLGSWWIARAPLGPTWAWTAEYAFLTREGPKVPEGTTVRYDGTQDPDLVFHAWLNERFPGTWLPLSSVPMEPDQWRYVGTADRLAGGAESVACGTAKVTQQAAPESDGWVSFGEQPILLGLYHVEACAETDEGPDGKKAEPTQQH